MLTQGTIILIAKTKFLALTELAKILLCLTLSALFLDC